MYPFDDPPSPWLAILPTVLGGVIAGLVGVFLAGWQRRRDARNEFLISISLVKAAMPAAGFYDFHCRSFKEIKNTIYRVLPFLGESRSDRLLAEWQSYYQIREDQLLDRDDDDLRRMAMELDGETPPIKPSELLKSHLDRMSKIVNKRFTLPRPPRTPLQI